MNDLKYKDNFMMLIFVLSLLTNGFLLHAILIFAIYKCRIWQLKYRNLFFGLFFIPLVLCFILANFSKNTPTFVNLMSAILLIILEIRLNMPLSVKQVKESKYVNTVVYDIILVFLLFIIYLGTLILLYLLFNYGEFV